MEMVFIVDVCVFVCEIIWEFQKNIKTQINAWFEEFLFSTNFAFVCIFLVWFIHSVLIWDLDFGWLITVQETIFNCSLLFTFVWLFIHMVDIFFIVPQISDIIFSIHCITQWYYLIEIGSERLFHLFIFSFRVKSLRQNKIIIINALNTYTHAQIELLRAMYATKIYLNMERRKKIDDKILK